MDWLDKLIEWWNKKDGKTFDEEVEDYRIRFYDMSNVEFLAALEHDRPKTWRQLTAEEKEDWRDFYRKEMER